ncbi:MAG: NmrA family NAD(P)-binding protein [bacterium]
MNLVVIGGSGRIGAKLVRILREEGHRAVPASRASDVNTLTREGLAASLEGADVVVDVSNASGLDAAATLKFFETSTANLLHAEAGAGVRHHVALSVVGTQRLSEAGYFRAKIAQEKLIEESSIPYSIVQATQFFEFILGIADGATVNNTVRCPSALIQPVAADDIARVVADVATASPLNGIVEVAGPQQFRLDELLRLRLSARHDPRDVIADPRARYFGAALAERTLVPGNDARLCHTHVRDWLISLQEKP